MNELVFQNATSIPSKQITIPVERIFGQNKPGFGKSEFRLNQMEPNQVMQLLTDKFSNVTLSKTQRSHSFYSRDSDASTEASVNKFILKRKPVSTRIHIPAHKNHYVQIQLELERERQAKIKQNSDFQQENEGQINNILHQDKGKLLKLKMDRAAKKTAKEEDKPIIQRINEANKEFLKNLFELSEDLVIPQQKKFKNTVKYKQTYQSSFKVKEREDMANLKKKNKFLPGPGDYEVKRAFENKLKINKIRSISMQQQGIIQETLEEEEDGRNMSQLNRIKNRLNKVLNIDQEQEYELMRNELMSNNYQSTNDNSQNTSYMFMKDDRDRFGQLIFPLSSQLPVPGPGKYEQNQYSIEKRLQAIQSSEEQKRLLKIWLHPGGKDELKPDKGSQQPRNYSLDPEGPIHLKNYQ
ncbi:hypothetical protein ABPG72_019086 [Tetrahymena utriculariae]